MRVHKHFCSLYTNTHSSDAPIYIYIHIFVCKSCLPSPCTFCFLCSKVHVQIEATHRNVFLRVIAYLFGVVVHVFRPFPLGQRPWVETTKTKPLFHFNDLRNNFADSCVCVVSIIFYPTLSNNISSEHCIKSLPCGTLHQTAQPKKLM